MSGARVDRGVHTFLAVCWCGWRELGLSHGGALGAGVSHERHAHPGHRDWSAAAGTYSKRHGGLL